MHILTPRNAKVGSINYHTTPLTNFIRFSQGSQGARSFKPGQFGGGGGQRGGFSGVRRFHYHLRIKQEEGSEKASGAGSDEENQADYDDENEVS